VQATAPLPGGNGWGSNLLRSTYLVVRVVIIEDARSFKRANECLTAMWNVGTRPDVVVLLLFFKVEGCFEK
jgi:hypothetical protein